MSGNFFGKNKFPLFFLAVSLVGGVPFLVALFDPEFHAYQSGGFFPTAMSLIGVIFLFATTIPAMIVSCFIGSLEKKNALIVTLLFGVFQIPVFCFVFKLM